MPTEDPVVVDEQKLAAAAGASDSEVHDESEVKQTDDTVHKTEASVVPEDEADGDDGGFAPDEPSAAEESDGAEPANAEQGDAEDGAESVHDSVLNAGGQEDENVEAPAADEEHEEDNAEHEDNEAHAADQDDVAQEAAQDTVAPEAHENGADANNAVIATHEDDNESVDEAEIAERMQNSAQQDVRTAEAGQELDRLVAKPEEYNEADEKDDDHDGAADADISFEVPQDFNQVLEAHDAEDGVSGDDALKEMIRDAQAEREQLRQTNQDLHKRILLLWEREPTARPPLSEESIAEDQIRHQLTKTLEAAHRLEEQLIEKKNTSDEKIDRLNQRLDQQDERATELGDSFKAFKREIARGSEFSRSGKPIKLKRILAFEAAEEEKDKEIETVRLKNIHYLNQLTKLELELKQKDELAEGLHLIDFEQLKIENQTLNEKIEERNDELHKLRKKTTTTVQVLTHMKEKLKFVQGERAGLRDELAKLDVQVVQLRDRLTRAKHHKEELRGENTVLKQKQGFVGSDLLVADFQKRKVEIEKMRAQIEEMKRRHAQLTAGSTQRSKK